MVCKTIIRRFDSARHLQLIVVLPVLFACADPPDPPPVTAAPSVARWVQWRAETEPVSRPVALIVDVEGGPLDRVVADADVTTFLNDRFHPVLRAPGAGEAGTVRFYTADGCAFGPPLRPADAAAFIDAANAVVVRAEARGRAAAALVTDCRGAPVVDVASGADPHAP